jgi:hypothetical protein
MEYPVRHDIAVITNESMNSSQRNEQLVSFQLSRQITKNHKIVSRILIPPNRIHLDLASDARDSSATMSKYGPHLSCHDQFITYKTRLANIKKHRLQDE